MSKIKIECDGFGMGLKPCPYDVELDYGYIVGVGSIACENECSYFGCYFEHEGSIICNHPEEKDND